MSGDDDDRVRRALEVAHRGETPPPFDTLVQRGPRRRQSRRAMVLAPLAFAGALLATLILWPHPPPPPPPLELSSLRLPSRGPLDFLLRTPGEAMLAETPRFDAKGDWP
jgi:hypothetical protein